MMLKPYDLFCQTCEYWEERFHDSKDGELVLKCPNCEEGDLQVVWIKAPLGRVGGDKSARSVASMRQSFKDRFIKKEIDDVRHKHGRLFDDSLRSAAAQRIKKEVGSG